jgi:cytidylate kinase
MTFRLPVLAIDGPAASGKGTIARRLAAHFDFAHLDTGLLYRAVALAVLQAGGDPADAFVAEKCAVTLDPAMVALSENGDALRADAVSVAAAQVASVPAVRARLLKFQRDFCTDPPGGKKGAVLDGRDIGTVIAPHASVKIYVDALINTRAHRRFNELLGRGAHVTYDAVLADMNERDLRDSSRAVAPAKPAQDAVRLDTTYMTADQAFAAAARIAEDKLGS